MKGLHVVLYSYTGNICDTQGACNQGDLMLLLLLLLQLLHPLLLGFLTLYSAMIYTIPTAP